jgi:exosome complex RNA-binding protein Csl4
MAPAKITALEFFLRNNRLVMPTDVIAVFEETVMVEGVWKDDGDSWTSYQVSLLEKPKSEQ